MPPYQEFTTRNSFYLRISATTVLQMLLLLDARHVDWMSPLVLEKALNALKDRIAVKLGAEEMHLSKKRRERDSEKVDVFRGAGWQMAYFFRATGHRHAVLLKNKDIVFDPLPSSKKEDSLPAPPLPSSNRRTPRKRKANPAIDDEEGIGEGEDVASRPLFRADSEELAPHAQIGTTSLASLQDGTEDLPFRVKEEEEDTVLQGRPTPYDEEGADRVDPLVQQIQEDEEEKIGKPRLKVSYTGFSIFGKTLVVIVEPYPPLRSYSRAPTEQRELSIDPRAASETPGPVSPGRDRLRSRSESASFPLRSAGQPLFRPETPIPGGDDEGEEDEMQRFRDRSQSIFTLTRREVEAEDEAGEFAHPGRR